MKTKPDLSFKTARDLSDNLTSQQTADLIQVELIELVDEFCTFDTNRNPITFINDMLYRWLTSPAADLLGEEQDQAKLQMGQNLIDFFTDLNVYLKELRHFQEKSEREQGKGAQDE